MITNVSRVAAYVRVSTHDQITQNQKAQIVMAMDRNLIKELQWIEDVESTRRTRPGFEALKKAIHKGQIKILYVVSLDRLARSTTEALDFLELCDTKRIRLIILDMGIDTSTHLGKFFFTIISAFAELERSMISERTKAGLERAKAQGKTLGRPILTTQAKTIQIMELRESGLSFRKIGKIVKLSRSTVFNCVQKMLSQNQE